MHVSLISTRVTSVNLAKIHESHVKLSRPNFTTFAKIRRLRLRGVYFRRASKLPAACDYCGSTLIKDLGSRLPRGISLYKLHHVPGLSSAAYYIGDLRLVNVIL